MSAARELIALQDLPGKCMMYGSGSAFHYLKRVDDRKKSAFFAIKNARISNVDAVTEEKWKVRLTVDADALQHVVRFEDQVKKAMVNTKVGNIYMSHDLVSKVASAASPPCTFSTTIVKSACTMFTDNDKDGQQIAPEQWHRLLRSGRHLKYVIVEPYQFWFLNENGSFTYRIRNMAMRLDESKPLSKTYAFDDD